MVKYRYADKSASLVTHTHALPFHCNFRFRFASNERPPYVCLSLTHYVAIGMSRSSVLQKCDELLFWLDSYNFITVKCYPYYYHIRIILN